MNVDIVYVCNRLEEPFSFMYDGRVYEIAGGATVPMWADAARHGVKKSIRRLNMETGKAVRTLAIVGEGKIAPLDPSILEDQELINRDTVEGGSKAAVISVSGFGPESGDEEEVAT